MDSLISIIVPIYNVEQYLDRCLESIVNQTYKNLEIILIDDSSPDNCPAMCDNWAKKDSRIKVIHIENKGVSNARNQGLDIASGDYIGFVDSDDWIEHDMIETLYRNLINNNADISVCGYKTNDEPDVQANLRDVTPIEALRLICMGDYKYGVLWNKLYKAELIKDIRMPAYVCCEDLVFNYYAFKTIKKACECDSKLYYYRDNCDSTVNGAFKEGAFDAVHSKELFLSEQKGTELEKYAVKGLVSSSFVVLSGVIQNGKFCDKYNYLRDYIVKNKSIIYSSNLYSKMDKLKTFILCLSPRLYNYLIKRKNS